jgi:hypothetical protein
LRSFLNDHTVRTAQEAGWGQLKNGALLKEAESHFEAFITTDQNIRYQQRIVGRKLAILVLPTNDWPTIRQRAESIKSVVASLTAGDFVELNWK